MGSRHRKSEQSTCRFQAVGTARARWQSTARIGELRWRCLVVPSLITVVTKPIILSQISRVPGEWKRWGRGLDSIFRLRLPGAGPCAIGFVMADFVRGE